MNILLTMRPSMEMSAPSSPKEEQTGSWVDSPVRPNSMSQFLNSQTFVPAQGVCGAGLQEGLNDSRTGLLRKMFDLYDMMNPKPKLNGTVRNIFGTESKDKIRMIHLQYTNNEKHNITNYVPFMISSLVQFLVSVQLVSYLPMGLLTLNEQGSS